MLERITESMCWEMPPSCTNSTPKSSSSWRGRHRVAYFWLLLGCKGCCCFTGAWFSLSEWKQVEANEQRSRIIRWELSRCNRDDREEKLVEVMLDAAVRTITSVVAVIERLASNPRPSSLLCWCSKREKIFSGIPAHFIQSGERTP